MSITSSYMLVIEVENVEKALFESKFICKYIFINPLPFKLENLENICRIKSSEVAAFKKRSWGDYVRKM